MIFFSVFGKLNASCNVMFDGSIVLNNWGPVGIFFS